MDPTLAEMYGTGGGESYMEKAAAAELLVKIAEEEGVDLSDVDFDDLSQEEIEALLEEALGDYEGDEGDYEEEIEKESMAKFAEADYLGRVMAHAMNQEMEKIAEGRMKAAWGGVKRGAGWLAGRGRKLSFGAGADPGMKVLRGPGRHREAYRTIREAITGKGSVGTGEMTLKDRLKAFGYGASRLAPEAVVGGGGAAALLARRRRNRR